MFDEAYTRQAVAQLALKGVAFAPGLGPSELNEIELAVGAKVPPELRVFWQTALPIGDDFPKWRDDPLAEAQQVPKLGC
ncbi:MAG TPA: hypothetical protein VG426_10065 [Candidatus Dormibacteraeota bacterium]|jgi:hypothetical protein|nr:hypothetical protein [Candidatus Dormibacteraeota bacterium]